MLHSYLQTWDLDPDKRPKFHEIRFRLEKIHDEVINGIYDTPHGQ
jgi:hypothetical protein